MIKIQTKAPNFNLLNQDKEEVKLSDYQDKVVLLYFYPKDDTPGCTKEACAIKEVYNDFIKAGIIILGVSSDSPESHVKFRNKYNIPFSLLSDTKKEVIKKYGALEPLGFTKRISYLIKKGIIIKVYPRVDPASHALEILKDIPISS